jgi:3',5'-cyclic AMP phosphodiesterase CpdA
VRYIVGGDSRDDLAHVLPWAFHEAKSRKAAAFLFLGDMEITPGLDAHFEEQLSLLDPVPFYPCLGNHEVRIFGFAPENREHAEKSFRDRFLGTKRTPVTSSVPGKVVYSVDLPGGMHFIALDNVSQKGFGADQLTWLEADLERARANPAVKYIVPGMHKPLAKNGFTPHAMDDDGAQAIAESDAVLAMFVKYKVTLIVASHLHQFGEFRQGGIPSYITGGLGAPLTGRDPAHAFHHFVQLDVSDGGIKVSVVRFDGKPSVESEPEVE